MNCYTILEIQANSSVQQIKEAYHKLATKYHPDKNPGNSAASELFKMVNVAYEQAMIGKNPKSYSPLKYSPSYTNYSKVSTKASSNQLNGKKSLKFNWAVIIFFITMVGIKCLLERIPFSGIFIGMSFLFCFLWVIGKSIDYLLYDEPFYRKSEV
jgi:hypothetical protein